MRLRLILPYMSKISNPEYLFYQLPNIYIRPQIRYLQTFPPFPPLDKIPAPSRFRPLLP